MFCIKCGTELPEDSLFCTRCGNATADEPAQMQAPPMPAAPPAPVSPQKKPLSKNALIGAAVGLVVVAGLVVGLVLGLGGRRNSYEQVIAAYFQAIEKADGEAFISLYPMNLILEMDIADQDEIDEVVDMFRSKVLRWWGRGITTTHRILDVDISSLDEFIDDYDMDYFLMQKSGITAYAEVEVRYTISGTEDTDTDTDTFTLIKMKNRWYLIEDPWFI